MTGGRGIVAAALAMALAIGSGCGGDGDEDEIALRVHGEPRAGVPSAVAWEETLEREAGIVTVDDETLILTTDVENEVWGLLTWRGALAFDIDPASTPWSRGPLVAVAGSRVLLSERRSDGPDDTWMVAFDVANGGQLWSVRLGLDDARPLVIGDEVIVATRDAAASGREGAVRAISLADGAERWSLPLDLAPDPDPDRGDYDDTAPVLRADGSTLAVRTARSSVAIVDVTEGREVGSFETEGEIITAQPVEDEGVVLVTEEIDPITARLHGVDADSAESRWSADANEAAIWVSGSAVVVHGIEHDYEALRISDGELLWTAAGRYGHVIAESEGTLITDRLAAISAGDGDVRWSDPDAFTDRVWFAPGVVISDRAGTITAFDLVTGDERWSRPASHVLASVGGDVLLAGDDQYTLVDGESGAELWTLTAPDGSSASALGHADGTLYMSVTDEGRSTVLAIQPAP